MGQRSNQINGDIIFLPGGGSLFYASTDSSRHDSSIQNPTPGPFMVDSSKGSLACTHGCGEVPLHLTS